MKKLSILGISLFVLLSSISSCEKDPVEDPTEKTGTINVDFKHVWGMNEVDFEMNTEYNHPMSGEAITFSTLKYYISNVKLQDMEGNWWEEEESYHLIDASNAADLSIELADVPAKHYVKMTYLVGVDSARNVAGAQTGALSQANNMFWSWNSGYIMIKAEGTESTNSATFAYHLGGFSGTNNILQTKTIDFSPHLMLEENATKTVNIKSNPAKFWHNLGSVANVSTIHMPGANAVLASSEYVGSFLLDSVE